MTTYPAIAVTGRQLPERRHAAPVRYVAWGSAVPWSGQVCPACRGDPGKASPDTMRHATDHTPDDHHREDRRP